MGSQFLSQLLNSVFFLGQFLAVQFYLFNFITVGQSNTAIENLVHISTGGNGNVHINGSIDQVVALGGGHIHRCGNRDNFPLGVIGFTLYGGSILSFGLALSVLIPFCGTSSLGYTVKTGLGHVNNSTIANNHDDTVTIRNASVTPRNCACIIDIDDSRIIHTITKAASCIAGNLFAAGQVNGFQVGASRKRCFKRCIIANHFQIFHLRESLSFYILQVCIAHSNFFELFTRREHFFPKICCCRIFLTSFQCANYFNRIQGRYSRITTTLSERVIRTCNFSTIFNHKFFDIATCKWHNVQYRFTMNCHLFQRFTIYECPIFYFLYTCWYIKFCNGTSRKCTIWNLFHTTA